MDKLQYKKKTKINERVKMVWLWANGHSVRAIARDTGTSLTTVYRWLHRYRQEGNVKTKPYNKNPTTKWQAELRKAERLRDIHNEPLGGLNHCCQFYQDKEFLGHSTLPFPHRTESYPNYYNQIYHHSECLEVYQPLEPINVRRRLAFAYMWANGASAREVAKETGMSMSTVYRWIKRWKRDKSISSNSGLSYSDRMEKAENAQAFSLDPYTQIFVNP